MALLRSTKRRIHNGWEVSGIAAFATTSLSFELPCELTKLTDFRAWALGTPGMGLVVPCPIAMPSVSATANFRSIAPCAGVISAVRYVAKEGQAAHASIGWDWHCINEGAAGSGTAVIVDRASSDGANTNLTGVGGGSALTAKTTKSLTVTSTLSDKTVVAGDSLIFTMTKNSTATTQTEGQALISILPSGGDERVYLDEAFGSDGLLGKPAAGTLTVARVGLSITSALKFAFCYRGI